MHLTLLVFETAGRAWRGLVRLFGRRRVRYCGECIHATADGFGADFRETCAATGGARDWGERACGLFAPDPERRGIHEAARNGEAQRLKGAR